jgi:hypothetical protein
MHPGLIPGQANCRHAKAVEAVEGLGSRHLAAPSSGWQCYTLIGSKCCWARNRCTPFVLPAYA